jgi:hypothetical protein
MSNVFQSDKLSLLLCKLQSTFGTLETSLAGSDLMETDGVPTLNVNPNATELDLVAGGFDQDASVMGVMENELNFSVPMRASGSDTPGQVGVLLEASGMLKAESVDGVFTYNFSSTQSEWKHLTAWMYSGALGASVSLLRKGGNGIIIPKWTFETGKPVKMDCKASLTFGGVAALATQPLVTKMRTIPAALLGCSLMTINGSAGYRMISCEIDPKQEAKLTVNPGDTYGNGLSVIVGRKLDWKAKVYKDLPATVDPETALLARTEGALTMSFGVVPQKVTFSATYSNINDIKHSNQNGVETWDISGQLVRNDFTITLHTK